MLNLCPTFEHEHEDGDGTRYATPNSAGGTSSTGTATIAGSD